MTQRRALLAVVLLTALALPAAAETFQANVPNGGIRTIGIINLTPGQAVITLTWARKSTDLDLILDCDGETWGISASTEERSERLEVGLFGGQTCTLGIVSFSGASRFWANIQFTGGNTVPLAPGTRAIRFERVNPADAPGLSEAAERISARKR